MNKSIILYIDDEQENLQSFKMTFWKFYDILLAENTAEAEEMLNKNTVELVISDQKMVGESGLEFIARIKGSYPHTLFILLTAYSDLNIAIEAVNIGVDRYIQKPWDYNELKHAIDNALEKYQLRIKNNELVDELKEINNKLRKSNEDLIKSTLELDKNQALLSAIYNNLPILVFLLDSTYNVLKVNRTGKLMANATEEELIGKNCCRVLKCAEFLYYEKVDPAKKTCSACVIQDAVNNSFEHKSNQYTNEGKLELLQNGTTKNMFVLVTTTFIKQDNNSVLLSIQDITVQKEHEQELKIQFEKTEALNEKLAAAVIKSKEGERLKSSILANISHEIRTPLNGILGFSDMLVNPNIEDSKKEVFSDVIKESSSRLLRVINDLLDISNIEIEDAKLVIESVCVNNILNDLKARFSRRAKKKGLALKLNTPATKLQSSTLTDRLRLIQIFDNLIGNAIKFTPEGTIEFGYKSIDENFNFYVSDTGIGIEQELFDKIFDGFYQVEMDTTREYSGIGIGLAITKKLLGFMGGKIWLESELNVGTTFYFTIPNNKI